MSIYAVISDIHGNFHNLQKAISIAKSEGADHFLILGDLLNHGPRNGVPSEYDPIKVADILNNIKSNTIIVKGNCDSEVDQMLIEQPISSISNILYINNRKCFMTHGHIYRENDTNKIGLSKGDIFMSGHTHVTVLKQNDNGVYILNPGSITFPKSGQEKTFALIYENKIVIKNLDGKNKYSLNY